MQVSALRKKKVKESQSRNVTPSLDTPSGAGLGALHRGLGVPSIALFLDLFSVKKAVEGFLYLCRCASAPLIILDLPSSLRFWKERYFLLVAAVGSTTLLIRKTHWASRLSGPLWRI